VQPRSGVPACALSPSRWRVGGRWSCPNRNRTALLRRHRELQDAEKDLAAQLWVDGDWVFASPTGRPLNPNTDDDEWKRLLGLAGVRDGRLHDARHTAATVLLILGVAERAVMEVMGWSSSAMARRYQHVTGQVRRDIAQRVGGLLWDEDRGRDA